MAKQPKSQAWRRAESREVRPFRSADGFLTDTALRLFADEPFKSDEALLLDGVDVSRIAMALRIPKVPSDFAEIVGIPPDELRLVATIEDTLFKTSMVLESMPLADAIDSSLELELDHLDIAHLSWTGELRLHVAVVLPRTRDGGDGTAWRSGSWVARKTFVIGRPRDIASFEIDAVDPEFFEKRGLPRMTSCLVDVDQDLNQGCENVPELIRVYLAKDVYAALARAETSPMVIAILRSIYVDVVGTVLSTGYRQLGGGALVSGSILEVVTERLAKSTGLAARRIRDLASLPSGAEIRAVAQADADLSRVWVSAARRRSS